MQNISASTGWAWFKEGFALFRRQPSEVSTLFLSYLFLMLVVGIVPLAGQVLPLILVPVFAMAFMDACVKIERNERVYPSVLFNAFKLPALKRLLALGGLYLVAAVAAISASTLVDGGAFLTMMTKTRTANSATLAQTNWAQGMLTAVLIYLPAAMCFWFAAPLIAWQNMPLVKALFYSFFAFARAGKAFMLYLFAWMLVGIILPSVLSTIIALVFGSTLISLMVLLPISLVLTAVLYCSFYPTYTTIFGGKPETDSSPG